MANDTQDDADSAISPLIKPDATNKNAKLFNVTNQNSQAFIKASNILLEPFSLTNRKYDHKALKKLRMPTNPIGINPQEKTVPSFVEFCQERNIPFNENELRYFKQNQNNHAKKVFKQTVVEFFNEIQLR